MPEPMPTRPTGLALLLGWRRLAAVTVAALLWGMLPSTFPSALEALDRVRHGEQFDLALELPVDRLLGHAGLMGHGVHGGLLGRAVEEDFPGRGKDSLSGRIHGNRLLDHLHKGPDITKRDRLNANTTFAVYNRMR